MVVSTSRPPQVPTVSDKGWSRNSIDRFIFRKLLAANLSPAEEADRPTLIRRVYFNLWGLPPTPQAIQDFVTDKSPQAYEKLIDRLLESPRYGERWAQHWLDLVRFAESDGFKADSFRPHAWRYRDYVIRAFNENMPYDQFVAEQLAGDEIAPNDPDVRVATGMLHAGIYEYNQADVRQQREDMLHDITDVTGDVFLGLSMGCARCHDHKFDPILQKDYFRLKAFFSPLLLRDATPLLTAEQSQKHSEWENQTGELREQIAQIERPHRAGFRSGAIGRFSADLKSLMVKYSKQESLTPRELQIVTLVDRQLALKNYQAFKSLKGEEKTRWSELNQQLSKFDHLRPPKDAMASTAIDVGPTSPATRIPGNSTENEILPGALSIFDPDPAFISPPSVAPQSSGRRLALARWITHSDHPLTARVMVNRLWQLHFGRGLVGTSSNFGKLGELPSHRELLDHLASRFMQQGWDIKAMHREILTSATYRQAAQARSPEQSQTIDPENRLLSHSNIRRLDAEQIRDAMLFVSGQLDLKRGGPSVNRAVDRRSIYTKQLRNTPDPLLASFDASERIASTSERNETTTPNQALMLLNGKWTLERASNTAQRLESSFPNESERIQQAYLLTYGKPPSAAQLAAAAEYFSKQPNKTNAWTDFCHVLLISNPFLYVD